MSEPIATLPRALKCKESDIEPTEQRQRLFTHVAPHEVTREVLLRPEYWQHITRQLKPFSEITVIAEDHSFYQKLLVIHVEGLEVSLRELEYVDLTRKSAESRHYEIYWGGKSAKFCVRRKSDKEKLVDGLYPREKAEEWMEKHGKAFAA